MQAYPLLIPLAGYFIGAIPFGAIIGKGVAKIDITSRGSGNIGATNVAREVGLKWGIVTLALDFLKGFLPVYIYYRYFGPSFHLGLYIMCLTPLLGHQFSPFLGQPVWLAQLLESSPSKREVGGSNPRLAHHSCNSPEYVSIRPPRVNVRP